MRRKWAKFLYDWEMGKKNKNNSSKSRNGNMNKLKRRIYEEKKFVSFARPVRDDGEP